MAKAKTQPLFLFTSGKDYEQILHVHITDARQSRGMRKFFSQPQRGYVSDVSLQAAKDRAIAGMLKEIHVYGTWRGDNGKLYEDLKPTVMTYDVSSGEYGWDVMVDQIRSVARSQPLPSSAVVEEPQPEEIKPTPGRTELEW